MDGNRVARKSVQDQEVEAHVGLSLQNDASIPFENFDFGFGVSQEREGLARNLDHLGIDLVEAHTVATVAICGEDPGP